jgi:hypothetical protein
MLLMSIAAVPTTWRSRIVPDVTRTNQAREGFLIN